MFEKQGRYTLIKILACSMIMISEKAAPITMEWSSVQMQEARVSGLSFLHSSDLWHQHDQCECQSIAIRDVLWLLSNIKYSYSPFNRKYPLEFFKMLNAHWPHPKHNKNP